MGKHASRMVSDVVQRLNSASQGDDELMELCLLTLESAVHGCHQECTPYLDQLLSICLTYIKYDPNYDDDDDHAMEDDDENSGDPGSNEDEEDYASYSDDEDTSWKVRRASAKLATALVSKYADALDSMYPRMAPVLVKRFKEREEAVRPDVYEAYTNIIVTIAERRPRPSHPATDKPMDGGNADAAMDPLLQSLLNDTPAVVRAAAGQLKGRSAKTKVLALKVVQELTKAVPHAVGQSMNVLVPGIAAVLADTSSGGSAMKTEALQLFNAVAAANPPEALQTFAAAVAPSLFSSAEDRYYAVSAEAYKACELLVKVIRPNPPAPIDPGLSILISPLMKVVMARLKAQDQSQEVKDAVISCAGTAVAWLGDELQGETGEVGPFFMCLCLL